MTAFALDSWLGAQLGGGVDMPQLQVRQLALCNQGLAWARAHSPFWRDRLHDAPQRLASLDDLATLPTSTPKLLREHAADMCCLPQGAFARVTTLQSSGTTGPPKRLYFTQADLHATEVFFQHGMRHIIAPGRSVLVVMPGERPGSVGMLLRQALVRDGVECHVHGFMTDPDALAADVARCDAGCLVAVPWQALLLARRFGSRLGVTRVLLSGDRAPAWMVEEIGRLLGADVFLHWGMTETGLGGAVECPAHDGLHLRALDLYVEVLHPVTGRPQPLGEVGVVAVTTLTRRGMPLFRYLTGDVTRLLPGPCACGSTLPRMENPIGRRAAQSFSVGESNLDGTALDEALLRLPWVEACVITLDETLSRPILHVQVSAASSATPSVGGRRCHEQALLRRCANVPGVKAALDAGCLSLHLQWASCKSILAVSPPKRQLLHRPPPIDTRHRIPRSAPLEASHV